MKYSNSFFFIFMIGVGIFSTVTEAVSETAFPTMHKFMSKSNLNKLKGVTHRGKAAANQYHEVIFAVKHKNLDWLKQTLEAVSYPDSPLYGKHLTRQEVADKICDPDTTKTVREYVEALGFTVQRETLYGEYIYVGGHVHQFEKLFSTSFHEYSVHNHNAKRQETLIRAEEYSIPVDLAEHVATVFKTVQFPAPVMKLSKNFRDISLTSSGKTTPQLIDSYYCIPSNTGNSLTSQAIYAALDQTMSPADLSTFQSQYDLPQQPIAGSYGGHVSSTTCNIDPQNCTEANLDVQYIMATSQVTPTYFFYWNGTDIWLDWITTVADQANPSDIFSISYGSYEDDIPFDYLDQFDIQAQTLGTLGTTLVASSGDDGVAGWLARDNIAECGYYPMFPASSPYVVAVGGTEGPQSDDPEVVCQANNGGVITSGGGFSNYYKRPAYQQTVVSAYLASLASDSTPPYPGYNSTNRGYPDVSLLAVNYQVVIGGNTYSLYGTSASAPVFGGFLALVNAYRKSTGGSLLGWVNPALYSVNYTSWVNDITSGDNNCCAIKNSGGVNCCLQGFDAVTGWDPATGLGSVNFKNFAKALAPTYPYDTCASEGFLSKNISLLTILIVMVMTFFGWSF